ncbi:MAG: metalloregulator ArsR/SmtB family transcription factor [Desulfovibrio sp.]|nr:metalloregulator ArsR/SmtB family transcription factor [Desulfovibrio sp.]MCA1985538.1 metalloregulator ArsR/SmtB family transcription factor [Desulfovibrio sp.]
MDLLACHKALADHTRLRLFHLLAHHELNVGEILDIVQMGQSRISRHLKILADAGLVTARRHGAWVFYSLAPEGDAAPFVRAMLPLLDSLPTAAEDQEAARLVVEERARQTRHFFDDLAPRLDAMQQEMLGGADVAGLVLEVLQTRPGCAVVADLGCGAGALLPGLLGLSQGGQRVIGVDSSARMLAQAARLVQREALPASRVSLRLGDLEHLPLSDGEAHCAVLSLVLHHLPSPRRGLAEAWRVLAPGGTCLVLDFARHEHEAMRKKYGDRWLGFEPAELASWCAEAGFVVESTDAHPLPHGLGLLRVIARKQ